MYYIAAVGPGRSSAVEVRRCPLNYFVASCIYHGEYCWEVEVVEYSKQLGRTMLEKEKMGRDSECCMKMKDYCGAAAKTFVRHTFLEYREVVSKKTFKPYSRRKVIDLDRGVASSP